MKAPTLNQIKAMDDEALRSLLGQDNALESFKEEIAKMDALPAAARREAEDRLQDRLTPRVDGESLRWIREDAVRATSKKQTGKEALADASPAATILD